MPTFAAYYSTAMVSIKECRVIIEILANVGFTLGRKTKPDHTVSTLTDKSCMKLALASAMLQKTWGTASKTPLLRTRLQRASQDASAPDTVQPPTWLPGCRVAPAW